MLKMHIPVKFRPCISIFHKVTTLFIVNREIEENWKIFQKDLKIYFRSFVILKMHFPVKFRPYISIFDKVTALLTLWEFDRESDGEFYKDVTGRSRDLLIILVLLQKLAK